MNGLHSRVARVLRGAGAPAILLVGLLSVNAVTIWGLVSARREVGSIAAADLELQTVAHARSLEAVLATLRGDLIFLSQAPPLSRALEILGENDPFARRQGRLDIEGTLYLFVESHPPLERLVLLGRDGRPLLAVGRRQGLPVFLGHDETTAGQDGSRSLVRSLWHLGPGIGAGVIEAWIDPDALLAIVAPTGRDHLELLHDAKADSSSPAAATDAAFVVRHDVIDLNWTPPIRWNLARHETESRLLGSFETLARRYRATLLLNLAVVTLALLLGAFAFRQARRAARLEAENRHQAQMSDLERRVQHSDRLASLGRLAAGFAHEINNPLAGMSNYLSLLRDDLRSGRAAEAPVLLERVQEGLDRVAGVVRRVLAFADPAKSPRLDVDLADVLERTVEFVRANPEFRHLEFHVDAQPRPLPISGDPTTLGQLFLNLVLNAAHAQPGTGRVDVHASAAAGSPSRPLAVVVVEDRGPGLSEEVRRRLFEPFHSTRGSTGLGLAICRGIVGEHGGTIRAENREDRGARFIVELPRGGTT